MLGQRIRNYRIIREIGKGGMGVVYEAIREDINIRAALKILRPEFAANEELAARFVNEARAANVIEHTGIVKVFDFGREPDGCVFLVMELLSGETLAKRIENNHKFSELEVARLGRQIAAAVAAAHKKEVIHREALRIYRDCLRFRASRAQRCMRHQDHAQPRRGAHLPAFFRIRRLLLLVAIFRR